jgi:hypothetical protein
VDVSAAPAADPATISLQEAAMAVFDVLQGSVIDSTPMDEFLTGTFDDSPLSEMLPTPGRSPMDLLGADIFMSTPLTGMIESFEDFPPVDAFEFGAATKQPPAMVAHPHLFDQLYTLTPDTSIEPSFLNTPMTPALQHFPMSGPAQPLEAPSTMPGPSTSTSTRRKAQPTGTRKNVTPETLVPLNAPIQPRKYLTPSSTSRKEVPATFARKRARSQAFGDDDDEEAPAPNPSMSEEEQIKAKRLQNTLAARRSRKRKLEHQQLLEDTIEAERADKEKWRAHAMVLEALLRDKGFTPPPPPM